MVVKVNPNVNTVKPTATKTIPLNTTAKPAVITQPKPVAPKLYNGLSREQEVQRTFDVINDRMKQGLDNSSQLAHYKNMTGREYTSLNPNSGVDMDKFGSMFSDFSSGIGDQIGGLSSMFGDQMKQMQSMYDGRMSALEKMIQEMGNTNKYNASQQQQTPVGGAQGVYDGSHIFTAPNQGASIGSTQSNNGVNDTLFKYLQNVWNGGF